MESKGGIKSAGDGFLQIDTHGCYFLLGCIWASAIGRSSMGAWSIRHEDELSEIKVPFGVLYSTEDKLGIVIPVNNTTLLLTCLPSTLDYSLSWEVLKFI